MKNKYIDLIIALGAGVLLAGTLIFRKKLEQLAKDKTKDFAAELLSEESGLSHDFSRKATDLIVD